MSPKVELIPARNLCSMVDTQNAVRCGIPDVDDIV